MKTDVEYLEFMWPMRHYLITCYRKQSEHHRLRYWTLGVFMHDAARARNERY
jgi:hypothetical protein